MQIIKVDAIESTNTFLKEALRNKSFNDTTCVWAKKQTNGRGQQGAKWNSEPYKNLTFSVFFNISGKKNTPAFFINMLTTISLHKTLNKLQLPNLKIKWPNDILSANKKIGGILIENNYQNGFLTGTIIGIGLNVNQTNFKNLPRASSLKNILNVNLNIEELLNDILIDLEVTFSTHLGGDFNFIKQKFESILFRNKKPSTFTAEGITFTGIIQGVNHEGKLIVLQEDEILNAYDLKEITLLY